MRHRVAITIDHAKRVQTLPFHHRDPFDRMMIAQAMEDGLTIVTRDRHFPAYGVPVLRLDRQSAFTSAAFATSVHFFSSAAVWAASSAGEDGEIS